MQPDHASISGGKRMKGILPHSDADHPLLTVVTAVFNGSKTLEATIQSVLSQTYSNIEYMIIDGGSTDGTLDVIRKYDDAIDYWLSEPDKGVYDAMNKGIKASTGTWLNFLNANDLYTDCTIIESVARKHFLGESKFIYSDVMLKDKKRPPRRVTCDHKRLILNHQASIYQKALHDEHGLYLVAPRVTISDYLFFSVISQNDFAKSDEPIAIYDTTGMSQSQKSTEQKFIIDYLINKMPKYEFSLYFYFYYPYAKFRRAFPNFLKRPTS
jgi:glycosyltransferase involved in cell wall biosynthesis